MTTTKINQKEYLKRYLSNDKDKKKKKKKKDKNAAGKANVKIIDADDPGGFGLEQSIQDESELYGLGDEAPQIVGVIDDRPAELKAKEDFGSSKWKKLAADPGEDRWGVPSGSRQGAGRRDSDASPPRRGKSPVQRRRKDSDESPPRRKERADRSPVRKRYEDSDASPPRRKDKERDKRDARKERRKYSSDESPPRRKSKSPVRKSKSDRSPARKRYSDSDPSPPRKRDKHQDEPFKSSRRRHDSDQSPPRKSRSNRRRDSDASPPRRRQEIKQERRDSDESPPRRGREIPQVRIKQEPRDSDESPPRKPNRRRDSDQSPPRRIKRERADSPEAGPSGRKMTLTLDGKRAGLQNARDLKVENEKSRRREDELFEQMSEEVSGRYAKTVVREKRRKREDVEEELRQEFEKRKRDEKKKEKYTRWGKGVKQVEDYKAQLEEAAHEMAKPLARYADDQDLDEHLKQQERIGDPMLDYIRSKKKEKDRAEGRPQKPQYKGSFPDNRFGIRPGYRWDGVDRSNGFEKKWFEMTSKKKAVEEEAYKYSVEDM
uniref:BUD13 homolog n=1 Tax=Culex pipiens TaxID=7175 RepID=A0A8D8HTZ5_CULPI